MSSTLNEMFDYEGKAFSPGMSTYSPLEGGMSLPAYQLKMTVSAKVDNLSSKDAEKLVFFMKSTLGYSKCVINKRKNTIHVSSIDGVDPSRVLGYIKSKIDADAH